ncbi:MAG: diaminopimelate epimerase [Deltaproteobacteria bacterium]|nr:diaminopimelate epimerase [Deltaproteobacteria bacterium]
MIEIPFYKAFPGGNPTILVMTSPPEPEVMVSLARRLMKDSHLGAEQVGFVSTLDDIPRLDMMGGEFCGNAARSLAAVLALESRTETDAPFETVISVSGAERPLACRVLSGLEAWVEIPLPDGLTVPAPNPVHLPGISHLLVDEDHSPFPSDWPTVVRKLLDVHGLADLPAAGCVWYRRTGISLSIKPCIRVAATHTLHAETACGSGSLALALNLGLDRCSIVQPSGHAICVRLDRGSDGYVERAWIGGKVEIVARGHAFV